MKGTITRYILTIALLICVWLGWRWAVALSITLMAVAEELKLLLMGRKFYAEDNE